jgi:hypothetical protein
LDVFARIVRDGVSELFCFEVMYCVADHEIVQDVRLLNLCGRISLDQGHQVSNCSFSSPKEVSFERIFLVFSPTTHMISSAVRGVIQTWLGIFLFDDVLTAGRLTGLVFIVRYATLLSSLHSFPTC